MAAVSCQKPHSVTAIPADLDNAKVLSISPEKILWLETSDSSVLYDLSNVNFLGEDRMVVQSRSFINLYDTAGNFVKVMAKKGDSPADYNWLSGCMWTDDSVFYLVDCNMKRVQKYNRNAEYLGCDSIPDRENHFGQLEDIYATDKGGIFYINSYIGGCEPHPSFSYSPDKDIPPHYIPGRRRIDGLTMYNRGAVIPGKEQVVYWEPLQDTVFSVTKEGVEPWFVMDYGKYDLPPEMKELPDVYDRFKMAEELGEKEVVSYMRYFQPHDKYLYFIVSMVKNLYIGCVDPERGKVAMTQILDSDSRLLAQPFFKLHDGKAYISVIDEQETEKNPGLFVVPIDSLAKP